VAIAVEMRWTHRMVDAIDAPLQKAPIVLQAVCVESINHVLTCGMLDYNVIVEFPANLVIAGVRIGDQLGSRLPFGVIEDKVSNGPLGYHWRNLGYDIAGIVQHSNNRCFIIQTALPGFLLVLMPVFLQTAHVGFVGLNLASHRLFEILMPKSIPNALKHEPSGFLGNNQVLCKLVAADALLVGIDDINSHEPLLERHLGISEDGPGPDVEVLFGVLATVFEPGAFIDF